ncbi:hypothetical protein KAR91_68615 [Candidatus Pacearchaeota archaeon]|nr:hypothetical protein [Candidatus Pacearchaeota archaeon]
MEKETYQINAQCSNCGRVQLAPVDVPKGQTWYHYVQETKLKCEHCGCTGCLNRVNTNLGE